MQRVSRSERRGHHGAVGNQGQVCPAPNELRLPYGDGVLLLGDLRLGGVVELLRLHEDDGVRLPQGGCQKSFRVVGIGGDDYLQPGGVTEVRLGGVGVTLGRAYPRTVGKPDHAPRCKPPACPVSHSCDMVEDLVVRRRGEPVKLEFRDGHETPRGESHVYAGDARLREGSVEDAVGAEFVLEAAGHLEDPAVLPHILAEDDYLTVPLHLLTKGHVQGVSHIDRGPAAGQRWLDAGGRVLRGGCAEVLAHLLHQNRGGHVVHVLEHIGGRGRVDGPEGPHGVFNLRRNRRGDGLLVGGVYDALVQQILFKPHNRVFLLPFTQLLGGLQFVGDKLGRTVRSHPVCVEFDEHRTHPPPRSFNRILRDLVRCDHVVPVDDDPVEPVGGGLLRDRLRCRLPRSL